MLNQVWLLAAMGVFACGSVDLAKAGDVFTWYADVHQAEPPWAVFTDDTLTGLDLNTKSGTVTLETVPVGNAGELR